MRKSIVPILLLCVVVLFCSCKPKVTNNLADTPSSNALKYGYNTLIGTDWGMTKEECMKALGVNEKNIKPIKEEYLSNENGVCERNGFNIQKDVYGIPATVSCVFTSTLGKSQCDLGLTLMYIDYKYGCDNKKIYDELYKELGANQPDPKYEMTADIKNLNETVLSKNSFKSLNDKELLAKAQKTFDKIWPNSKMKYESINFTRVVLRSKPNEDTSIFCDGTFAAILHSLL